MKRRLVLLFLLSVFAPEYVFGVAASTANQSQQKTPADIVGAIGKRALGVINRPGVTKQMVKNEFAAILAAYFAVEKIARFVLGPNFRRLQGGEKMSFLEAFTNMLIQFYSSRFSEYRSAQFSVDRVEHAGADHEIVTSKISLPGKSPMRVKWSLFLVNGRWLVYDVVIDDVSISRIQRDGISGEITSGGWAEFFSDFKQKHANP